MSRHKDPIEAREAVLRRVQTEGIEAALEGALRVLRDAKSPAPAVATAATLMFRSAGLLDRALDADGEKDLHEMTGEELSRHRAKLEAQAAAIERGRDADVFG